MNTTAKAILISLGSLFTALFLIFAIGMCTPGFRGMMFRMWNVVPEQQYTEKANSEASLTEELGICNQQLNQLTTEKQNLLNRVSQLDATNTSQAEQIAEYTVQINDLDSQIKALNKRINSITATIANANISFEGMQSRIHLPVFDTNGNLMYHTSYDMTENTFYYNGASVINEINERYNHIETNLNQAINSSLLATMSITEYDRYNINIDGYMSSMETNYNDFNFSSDCVVNTEILYNDEASDFDTILGDIITSRNYTLTRSFAYTKDANNRIDSLTLHIEINQR